MEAELAAAAPSAADLEEEAPEPLTPEADEAAIPSVASDEVPSTGTLTPPSVPFNTPEGSRSSLDWEQSFTRETLRQALLEVQALRQQQNEASSLQKRMAGEKEAATAGREVSSGPAMHSTHSPLPGTTTEGAAEAAPALPRASCAPQSPAEKNINREILSWALLEVQALRQQLAEVDAPQYCLAVEVESAAKGKREESQVPAPQSPPSPWPAQLGAQAPREQQEEAEVGSVQAVGERNEDSSEEMKWWQHLDDLEPFLVTHPEQSQAVSEREEYVEREVSPRKVSSSRGRSGWEEYVDKWLSKGDVSSGEEISECEENIGGGMSRGNASGSSGPSNWENDSHEELVQGNLEDATQHGIRTKALRPEDDEWDDVSVLELPPEEEKVLKWREDGLPVPAPARGVKETRKKMKKAKAKKMNKMNMKKDMKIKKMVKMKKRMKMKGRRSSSAGVSGSACCALEKTKTRTKTKSRTKTKKKMKATYEMKKMETVKKMKMMKNRKKMMTTKKTKKT
ncbi:hypothetical protein HGM15179_018433 [Zosterops borbonicus]|uniref:Uncharacterized protein n=1 Tax=Zosterops borbonicus TaxID=364589 RepID=A0A8K1FZ18_9PASS|nr:hypothetical protein HGM15179_018433 [Zosterops borbonicus]